MNISTEKEAFNVTEFEKSGNLNWSASWMYRNTISFYLMVFAGLCATVWLTFLLIKFSSEIVGLYRTSKSYLCNCSAFWRKSKYRNRNSKRAKLGLEPERTRQRSKSKSRLDMDDMKKAERESRKIAINTHGRTNLKGDRSSRRNQIKIIDDIYGEIVGYFDSEQPTESDPTIQNHKSRNLGPKEFSISRQRLQVQENYSKILIHGNNVDDKSHQHTGCVITEEKTIAVQTQTCSGTRVQQKEVDKHRYGFAGNSFNSVARKTREVKCFVLDPKTLETVAKPQVLSERVECWRFPTK